MDKVLIEKMRWRSDVKDMFDYDDLWRTVGYRLNKFEGFKELPSYSDYKKSKSYNANEVKEVERLCRYIVLCYHTRSPLIVIDNFMDRSKACCRECGIDFDSDYFQEMLRGENEKFNYAIIEFVALENNPYYGLLIQNENVYRSSLVEMMGMTDTKKKLEANVSSNKLFETIEGLKLRVFSGDKVVGNYVSSFSLNQVDRKISPEDYVLEK